MNSPIKIKFPILKLQNWYDYHKRDLPWRKTTQIYNIWVSEIMLQQTQVNTVIPYYQRFMKKFPTINHLAEASEQEVLKLWEGLGYYSRARNLHKAAKKIVESNEPIPVNPNEFIKLPGVGPYISAAVLSISNNLPIPVVDGNVLRVCTRFWGIGNDIRKNKTRNLIFNELKEIIPPINPGDFNQALMELGALVCTPQNPNCPLCPLQLNCYAYKTQTIKGFPFKSPLKNTPEYNVSVGVIFKSNKFYIQKRPSKGHLGGLWEFPGGKSKKDESPEETLKRECREEIGVDIFIIKKLAHIHHAYTHFKINMSIFICGIEKGKINPSHDIPFQWITFNELDLYPFPGANHKFFPALKEYIGNII